MKTLIAAALALSAGLAQAHSFAHEKALGTAELFTTLNTEGVVSTTVPGDREFAYQRALGTVELFPTLGVEESQPRGVIGRTVFTYQRAIGSAELDPSLSS